ncbi:hypothetical protein [Paracoccus simplex]|uniref:Uncharacterized protein n=1 Tax=Paracoccus simplex TaxID=2086346 RepID=A0ABV7RZE4_9RHOB
MSNLFWLTDARMACLQPLLFQGEEIRKQAGGFALTNGQKHALAAGEF